MFPNVATQPTDRHVSWSHTHRDGFVAIAAAWRDRAAASG